MSFWLKRTKAGNLFRSQIFIKFAPLFLNLPSVLEQHQQHSSHPKIHFSI